MYRKKITTIKLYRLLRFYQAHKYKMHLDANISQVHRQVKYYTDTSTRTSRFELGLKFAKVGNKSLACQNTFQKELWAM